MDSIPDSRGLSVHLDSNLGSSFKKIDNTVSDFPVGNLVFSGLYVFELEFIGECFHFLVKIGFRFFSLVKILFF